MPRRAEGRLTGQPVTTEIPQPAGGVKLVTFIPWTLVKQGMKVMPQRSHLLPQGCCH